MDRVKTESNFSEIFKAGEKTVTKYHIFLAKPNTYNKPRLGIIVAKKYISRAVARNKIKRIIRESFRAIKSTLPAWDLIIMVRPIITTINKTQLRVELDKQWQTFVV